MAAAVRLLLISLLIFSHYTPSLSTGEDVHLLEFKEGFQNSSALDSTWRNGTHPCRDKWRGIECEDKNNVSSLILVGLGLSGSSQQMDIEALSNLERLRFVSLENNSISGPIPEFNRLTSLRSLFISSNQFSGEIPDNFFDNMGSLKKLDLARNKFSGKIPASLEKLGNLVQLSLENNEFSGPIPSIGQQSLVEVNFSNNKLQGKIPQIMSRFGPKPFDGNTDLCGPIVSKPCNANGLPGTNANNSSSDSDAGTKWLILGIVVTVLLMTILFNKAKKREENFSVLGKESSNEVVQVRIPSSNRRSMSRKAGSYKDPGTRSLRRGMSTGKHGNDLVMVNEEKGIFGLQDLMKAAAEVLGSGGLGSAYKAIMGNGASVVVKRFRDMNKLNRDAFDAEVRRLGRIRHRNILPPLAYHYRKEEKLLVTEFVPKGSLTFLLHGDRGSTSHAELTWPIRLKIIKGVARGMGFLHTEFANYELPHGNLKSSNILLSSNYEPLLTDYALYALISNTHSVQALFSYKCPEAVLYQQLSPKSDVYCLGVVILEIMTGKFPSQYLNNQKGGTDVVHWIRQAVSEERVSELIDPEIVNTSSSFGQMEKMLFIGAACTGSDHDKRIEMREVIRNIEEIQV
ncbi:hypothetical protein RD792_006072 [Penstemon davidsonii]|uniref:Protein kinase domain-containing protein n=1 Tax=Penstemon davidsonii TaxID=160366 RepID=A0ABR0DE65_9LAMI|nr:hypothetical protein RD792_006072 [Penstemon davidsonii]